MNEWLEVNFQPLIRNFQPFPGGMEFTYQVHRVGHQDSFPELKEWVQLAGITVEERSVIAISEQLFNLYREFPQEFDFIEFKFDQREGPVYYRFGRN